MDNKQINDKLAQAESALQKAAQYVIKVQPEIDNYNEMFDKFVKRAHQSVGNLVGCGLVSERKANGLIDKMAEDITVAFDVIDKIASMTSSVKMGSSSDVSVPAKSSDPWVNFVYGESNSENQSNMVE